MEFRLQLNLLLWKNFKLKKRSPFVVLLELIIPLVLFFILLGIRRKQPAVNEPASSFSAWPLPSSGVVGVMQAFCDGGVTDDQGFLKFPNATTKEFLSNLNKVALSHKIFDAEFTPQDLGEVPGMYRALIEEPIGIGRVAGAPDCTYCLAKFYHVYEQNFAAFSVASILVNKTQFRDDLKRNFSFDDTMVDSILNTKLNEHAIHQYLFGALPNRTQGPRQRLRRSAQDQSTNHGRVLSFLRLLSNEQSFDSVDSLSATSASAHPLSLAALRQIYGLRHTPNQHGQSSVAGVTSDEQSALFSSMLSSPKNGNLSDSDVAEGLTRIILSATELRHYSCHASRVPKIEMSSDSETIPTTASSHSESSRLSHSNDTSLQPVLAKVCNMSDAELNELSTFLVRQVNYTKLARNMKLRQADMGNTTKRLHNLAVNIEKYNTFRRTLKELSELAEHFPLNECFEDFGVSHAQQANGSSLSTTTEQTEQRRQNDTRGRSTNSSEANDDDFEFDMRKNATLAFSRIRSRNRGRGFLKVWNAMQKVICGSQKTVEEHALDPSQEDSFSSSQSQMNFEALGLSNQQARNLKLLAHLFQGNPKILYAPANTSADLIIERANSTFALIDNVTAYARAVLNVSDSIQGYLLLNSTEHNLQDMRRLQAEMRLLVPLLTATGDYTPALQEFLNESYLPDSAELLRQLRITRRAACSWISLMSGVEVNLFRGFCSEEALTKYFLKQAYWDNVTVFASVIFQMNPDGSLPPHMIYTIRQNASYTTTTRAVRSLWWYPGPRNWDYSYYTWGFLWIQDVMERAMIDLYAGRGIVEPGTYIQEFPYPCYVWNNFLFMIEHVLPMCLAISWIYYVAMLVQSIVYEKENRLKEVMKMMGLTNTVHWLAWFLTSFSQMTFTMIALTIILKYGDVLSHSNPLLVFIMLEMFAAATVTLSFLISTFYSKAKLAAASAGIIYFISYVPFLYIAIREEAAHVTIPAWAKSIASLSSTTAIGLSAKYFAYYEMEGVGVQWHNLHLSPLEGDGFSLLHCFCFLALDLFLYAFLVWYIEKVSPGQYGLPRPWYFLVSPAYWSGHSDLAAENTSCWDRKKKQKTGFDFMPEELTEFKSDPPLLSEPEPLHLPAGVKIENLCKLYKATNKLAVNHLCLNLYQGQITALLGHNGAGKTTTMSMLTGLFPPTQGSATICGKDIRFDMDSIRKSMGTCPQHNVLFDKLTVQEHLWFYARLKGTPVEEIGAEIEKIIWDLGLPDKRDWSVEALSGGMKRKLSVAIAFIGGSRTVILDEPTAGVDPFARRAIWDLILKYKKGRTIMLSTHHMDEADIVGDRIAIISAGHLKVCGSPLFLKSYLGEGYQLTFVKKILGDDISDTDSAISIETTSRSFSTLSSSVQSPPRSSFYSLCDAEKVEQFLKKFDKNVVLKHQSLHELCFALKSWKGQQMVKLLEALENQDQLATLNVASFGLKDTTLEEIFLKISHMPEKLPTVSSDTGELDQTGFSEADSLSIGDSAAGSSCRSSFRSAIASQSSARQMTANLTRLATMPERTKLRFRDIDDNSIILPDDSLDCAGINTGGGKEPSVELRELETPKAPGSPSKHPMLSGLLCSTDTRVIGNALYAQQFMALIWKRFLYIRRNPRAVFSQILLPALFVVVAMSVALSVILLEDLPEMSLSPSQYYNYTQPWGNVVSFAVVNDNSDHLASRQNDSDYVTAQQLKATLYLPSGIGATCLLFSPNETLSEPPRQSSPATNALSMNSSLLANHFQTIDDDPSVVKGRQDRNFTLLKDYFIPDCANVFVEGVMLQNFVPPTKTEQAILQQQQAERDSGDTKQPLSTAKMGMLHSMTTTNKPEIQKYYSECSCAADGTGFICPRSGFTDPPSLRLITADILLDITGQNETEYYLYTTDDFRLRRYGGFSFGHELEHIPPEFGRTGPELYRKFAVRQVSKVWYDNTGYHAMPIYVNTINNAILRAALPPERGNPAAYGITIINHPMVGTNARLSQEKILEGTDVLIAMFVVTAMSFVPASFVLFLVQERYIGAKHLQSLSGLSHWVYWSSNLCWDLLNYLIPALCCCIILRIFNIPAYVADYNFTAVVSLFMLYGWSITPMMYPAAFYFKEPSTAYICMIVLNLFLGLTCIMTSFLLEMFSAVSGSADSEYFSRVYQTLRLLFMLFPSFSLGRGLMDIAYNHYFNEFFQGTGQYDRVRSPFQWDIINKNLVSMAVIGLCSFGLTLLLEYYYTSRRRRRDDFDSGVIAGAELMERDVLLERKRVLSGRADNDILRVVNVSKVYKSSKEGDHMAVDQLCLGVPQGECFGLLGVNGAGKTSTFRMLTGDLSLSAGDVFIANQSVLSNLTTAQKHLGYCPQFDALYDELTGREHLRMYALIRGLSACHAEKMVDTCIERLGLTSHADRPSGTYSGGTKRKLSTAIALIGDPDMLLLDEPSSGMDPGARRFLWDVLTDLVKSGKSVVLTSHSMEECEALCTRLAIMVNGSFQCLGSIQELKNKYGDGYSLRYRLKPETSEESTQNRDRVQKFMTRKFADATLKECHYSYMHYEVNSTIPLSRLFRIAEEAVAALAVQSYSISQNNLDNVFVNFVKHQGEDAKAQRLQRQRLPTAHHVDFDPLDDSLMFSCETELKPLEKSAAAASTSGFAEAESEASA